MMKIILVAAAALTTVLLNFPARAHGVKVAQVDMRTGLHLDDPANSRDPRRYDSNAANGPRQGCRVVTATIKRDDGRRITRKERVCN
jgi:hypothetical protein